MKRYIYPMVLFTDENELYTALYPDLNLLASGTSIEDVYARANDYLDFYVMSALKFETGLSGATNFAEVQALNPKKIVLLASADVDETSIVLTEQEQADKNFLKKFVFTEDD